MAVAVCLVVLSFSATVARAAAPFGANVRVSDDPLASNEHKPTAVADATGNVYAFWGQNHDGDTDVRFASSPDGGRTWSPSKRIGGNPPAGSTQDRPAAALGPNGELVVVWQDDRLTYFDFDIFASVSFDRGATFTTPVKVSDGPAGTLQIAPTVAVGATGRVFVAWQDYRSGSGQVRLSAATLPGFVFGPSVRVDDDPGVWTAAAPSVAVTPAGMVYVGYHDNRSGSADAYLARSSDGGASFSPSIRIDDTGAASSAQGLVSIAVDGLGRVYAAWEDSRAGEVEADGRFIFDTYFAKSTDGGLSFSRNIRVDDGPKKTSQEAPRISVGAAGTIYVVWDDARNTDWDPYLVTSTNGGASFGTNIRLDDAGDSTTDPPLQYDPQVVESRTGLVFALWEDDRGATADIYGATGYFAVGSALRVRMTLETDTAWPGDPAALTVQVTDNGTAVANASISLSSSGAGAFGAVEDLGGGSYRSFFASSPSTSNGTDLVLTATAQKPGYVSGASQVLLHIRKPLAVSVEPQWDLLASGQSMSLHAVATAHGAPLSGGTASATVVGGGVLSPASGSTDGQGSWSTSFTAPSTSVNTNVTLTVAVTKDGYIPATARVVIPILAQARLLEVVVTSATREMMGSERATLLVSVTSGGVGVSRAVITSFCPRGGNFSAVAETSPGSYSFTWQAPNVSTSTWVSIVTRVQRGGYMDASTRLLLLADPNMTRPGDPTQLFVLVIAQSTVVQGGHSISVTLYVYTIQGYTVSGAAISVLVSGGLGIVTRPVDELNGKYSFVYTAPHVAWSTGVLVRIDASKYGYAPGSARIALMITP